MIENFRCRPRPAAAHSSGLRNGSPTFDCGLVQQLECTRLGSAAHSGAVTVANSISSIATCSWSLARNAGLVCASTCRWYEQPTLLRSRSVHSGVPGLGSPAYWSQTPGVVLGVTFWVGVASAKSGARTVTAAASTIAAAPRRLDDFKAGMFGPPACLSPPLTSVMPDRSLGAAGYERLRGALAELVALTASGAEIVQPPSDRRL